VLRDEGRRAWAAGDVVGYAVGEIEVEDEK
jgi:hypothetical protein